ncbi:MAG TPA: App1 family protein, partial [Herpetosiphonaceae bacterium]|nr:App1 family protein [Herpetosiphonaceae bacterium]
KQIRTILETHASLPFVLIGDSGQEDPEIYKEVVRAFPGRIKAIYIRDVTLEARDRSIRTLIDELRGSNIEMVLTGDTIAAAEHALQHGLIAATELPAIRAKKVEDQQDPTVLEQLPGIGSATSE